MIEQTLFPEPVFITRLLHIDPLLAEEFKGQKSFLITANFFADERYSRLARIAREGCDVLIINPVTNFFTYNGYVNKPTYSKLPYAPTSPFTRNDLRQLTETNFTKQVIDWQITNGAGIIIAPYFFAHDLDDRKYEYNLQLISHTINITDNYKKQVWACINISQSALSGANLSDLISDYKSIQVDGFLILLEGFDDRIMTTDKIINLLRLVDILSQNKDIIICSIGAFGQILFAYGANGFSGGIGWLETFSERQLEGEEVGYPADSVPRAWYYYIPEVFSYFRPDDINTIFDLQKTPSDLIKSLKCECTICSREMPSEPMDKK